MIEWRSVLGAIAAMSIIRDSMVMWNRRRIKTTMIWLCNNYAEQPTEQWYRVFRKHMAKVFNQQQLETSRKTWDKYYFHTCFHPRFQQATGEDLGNIKYIRDLYY